jgi:hypothetical protein
MFSSYMKMLITAILGENTFGDLSPLLQRGAL